MLEFDLNSTSHTGTDIFKKQGVYKVTFPQSCKGDHPSLKVNFKVSCKNNIKVFLVKIDINLKKWILTGLFSICNFSNENSIQYLCKKKTFF